MIVLKSYATWVTVAVLGGLVGLFAIGDDSMIAEMMRVVATAYMLMMMTAYASTAGSCYLTPGWPEREHWAGLVTFVLALCGAISGLVSLFFRLSGKPAWVLERPIINAFSFGLIVWAAVFTTAPGFFGERVSRRTKLSIAGLWIVAITFVAFLSFARSDLAPVVRWVERTFMHGSPS